MLALLLVNKSASELSNDSVVSSHARQQEPTCLFFTYTGCGFSQVQCGCWSWFDSQTVQREHVYHQLWVSINK